MNPIAVYFDNTVLYWSAIIITVGLLAALMMSLSLQVTNKGRIVSMMLFFPLALLFSIPLCRMLHWYCHQEQYDGFFKAMTDYSAGSYVLPAAIPGVWLAAWIAAKLDDGDTAKLLDAAAPGMALVIAFVRLSALFSSACRSKISVTTGVLQHLPIAAGITNSAGVTEYRFATFFIHFLLMLLFCLLLLKFFMKYRSFPMKAGRREGNTVNMFLLLYAASEMILDSTRYDSSFLPQNGFVSIVQIVTAVCILLLLIHYSRLSILANGMHFWHWLLWIVWLIFLLGVGATEYLVQRHGDWYLGCYGAMALCCIILIAVVYRLYVTASGRIEDEGEEEDEGKPAESAE